MTCLSETPKAPPPRAEVGFEIPFEALEPWWKDVWLRHQGTYVEQQATKPSDETELRHELLFCLLGGHSISFELAASATGVIASLDPFAADWTMPKLRSEVCRELSRAQFNPPCRDGSLRRYRFPKRKAALLSEAAQWVRKQSSIEDGLSARESESDRREWLCRCPGVGFKTASWLLRNCGWAEELAILDVHLLRALKEVGLIDSIALPRDYQAVEQTFLRWAQELDAQPGALDLFLWDLQRVRPTT